MATTESDTQDEKWINSLTGRIAAATAAVTTVIALVNGAGDLIKTMLNLPKNIYEETNDALFKKNFLKPPIVSQPVEIKTASAKVEMLLQVYENGDVFVRYGEFQQWLPFKSVKISSASILPLAAAQTQTPVQAIEQPQDQARSPNRPIILIDLEKLQKGESPIDASPTQKTVQRTYLLAKSQDAQIRFVPTRHTYEQIFDAEPGYVFIKHDLDIGASKRSSVDKIETINNGRSIKIQYTLISGPFFDQYKGWVHATLRTEQKKVN